MQEEALARLRLISDLRGALAAEQFRVYFQPVLDLKTRRICGAEALLRWEHPTRGMVSPAGFIPLAEETGLIMGIGDWVFREAARWARRWVDRLGADFRVSVNNSPLQFRNAPGILSWLQFLREIELPGRNMTIEITEGLLLDADAGVKDVLRRLREDGLRVAIDDFGTGYSSLAYLHRFQIDALKIDQSFTRNLQTQPSAKALSESIIAMAHKLGLSVVAEGIETAEQLDFLVSAGCDFGQGYLFSRPIPAEAFERLVLDGIPAVAGSA
jgi:EAL domain-containing protein (putative c-di-GMP-specific phosphodiesterase class I)